MSPPFHDIRFPTQISRHAVATWERKTEVFTLASGHEQRNTRWAHPKRSYKIGFGIKTFDDLSIVVDFFEERRGALHAFRFKDPLDHRSCLPSQTPTHDDQLLGYGDGNTRDFPLIKAYGATLSAPSRRITKPVAHTVHIGENGTRLAPDAFSVDPLTGVVSFASPPPQGATITAGFFFDVPVRFETLPLSIDMDAFEAGSAPDIALIEVRQ